MGTMTMLPIGDKSREGEGSLVITIGDTESVQIGDVRVHLSGIPCTGSEGGRRQVRLVIIGPKTTCFKRIPR